MLHANIEDVIAEHILAIRHLLVVISANAKTLMDGGILVVIHPKNTV